MWKPLKNNQFSRHKHRGQAFVELALMTPVTLLLIIGMLEVVFAFNDYLQMLDGVRNGARNSADQNPYPNSVTAYDVTGGINRNCSTTTQFFRLVGCDTDRFLAPIDIFSNGVGDGSASNSSLPCIDPVTEQDLVANDIVVSVFTTAVVDPDGSGGNPPYIDLLRFDINEYVSPVEQRLVVDTDDSGWSYIRDQTRSGSGAVYDGSQYNSGSPFYARGMCSKFKKDIHIEPLLLGCASGSACTDVSAAAPNSGYVLVEVFYLHHQLFDAPIFNEIMPNPIPLHAYAFFPLSGAKPTATPKP